MKNINYIALIASVAHAFCFFCVLYTNLDDMPYHQYFKPFLLAILFVASIYYLIMSFVKDDKSPSVSE